jgi:hypothetical protein
MGRVLAAALVSFGALFGALDAQAARRAAPSDLAARAFADPLVWLSSCAPSADLASYQAEVLAQLGPERRVAMRKGRGAGGSATAALSVWWFASTREARGIPWKILTTAGSAAQLSRYLWPEIHLWQRRLNLEPLGLGSGSLDLLKQEIHGQWGQAFARATDDPDLIEGGHAAELFVLLDEAAAIEDAIWNSIEGMFASATSGRATRAFAISKPGEDVGRFFGICSGKVTGWRTRHVTLEEAIAAGRVSASWARDMAELWGEDSPLYLNHVLAEFAQGGAEGAVIPLWAIRAAMDRWTVLKESGALSSIVPTAYGLDVGTGQPGRDPATLAAGAGDVVIAVDIVPPALNPQDTEMHLAGVLGAKLERKDTKAGLDANGYGGGTLSRLRELKHNVFGFVAAAGSEKRTADGQFGFANLRAESIYGLRERLIAPRSTIAIPDEQNLLGELSEPRMKGVTSTSKILVESKEEIAKRIRKRADRTDQGGSTNRADAIAILSWLATQSETASGSLITFPRRERTVGLR